MKVINFFGAPCSGKSRNAAALFTLMKDSGYNVELIQEIAKHLVWAKRYKSLDDQLYIFAKQNDRLHTLDGEIDYAISDSPLILSSLYMPENYPPSFPPFVRDIFDRYDNLNIFLKRTYPYQEKGRIHTEVESMTIENRLYNYLQDEHIPFIELNSDSETSTKVFDIINNTYKVVQREIN
ncbi:MAG: AAA family ATPase [Proteobacteria bacterium]|nr:AAA family ATPase [Pseudomonadota bacterium]